ncbi:hypothetical protein EZS27_036895 [termite gut metagenome]|uniref:Uncharacterized protein n=1 Tax=termite gut metagenome TaxID=433724 RepID=A0A5J4PTL7_9ZZZZ
MRRALPCLYVIDRVIAMNIANKALSYVASSLNALPVMDDIVNIIVNIPIIIICLWVKITYRSGVFSLKKKME